MFVSKLNFFPVSSVSYALVSFKIFPFSDQIFSVQSVQTVVIKIFPFSHCSEHVPLLLKSQCWLISFIKFQPACFLALVNSCYCPLLLESLLISSAGNAWGWEAGGVVTDFLLQLPPLKGCSESKTCGRWKWLGVTSLIFFRKCLEMFTKHSLKAFRMKTQHNFSAGMRMQTPVFPASFAALAASMECVSQDHT